MNRWGYIVFCSTILTFLISSCSSVRILEKSQFLEGITEKEYLGNVFSNLGEWEAVTAKMTMVVDFDGKGATKMNGVLRIKKGKVVQISITPLLGIEVGRAEISSDGILVVDRMNKRYTQISFAEIETFIHADLDFHVLQALFLNEVFLPNKSHLTLRDVSSFNLEPRENGVLLDVKRTKRFSYQFLTKAPEGLLQETLIGVNETPYVLTWKYDDFRSLDKRLFPTDMRLSLKGGRKPLQASINLSRLSTNADWETYTEVSNKYEKMKLDDILKLLLKK